MSLQINEEIKKLIVSEFSEDTFIDGASAAAIMFMGPARFKTAEEELASILKNNDDAAATEMLKQKSGLSKDAAVLLTINALSLLIEHGVAGTLVDNT
jgi:hypothetical protein